MLSGWLLVLACITGQLPLVPAAPAAPVLSESADLSPTAWSSTLVYFTPMPATSTSSVRATTMATATTIAQAVATAAPAPAAAAAASEDDDEDDAVLAFMPPQTIDEKRHPLAIVAVIEADAEDAATGEMTPVAAGMVVATTLRSAKPTASSQATGAAVFDPNVPFDLTFRIGSADLVPTSLMSFGSNTVLTVQVGGMKRRTPAVSRTATLDFHDLEMTFPKVTLHPPYASFVVTEGSYTIGINTAFRLDMLDELGPGEWRDIDVNMYQNNVPRTAMDMHIIARVKWEPPSARTPSDGLLLVGRIDSTDTPAF
ncbi:hypothetical protein CAUPRSCDRAFT_10697 [Caulochytrium protostelioides]|nr:hypothetical protein CAUPRSCDRAFT_10697 [Caulochytrium protostelioides]